MSDPVPQARTDALNRARDAVRARVDASRNAPTTDGKRKKRFDPNSEEWQADLSRWYDAQQRRKTSPSTPVPPKAPVITQRPDDIREGDHFPDLPPHDPPAPKMRPSEHPDEPLHAIHHPTKEVRRRINLSASAEPDFDTRFDAPLDLDAPATSPTPTGWRASDGSLLLDWLGSFWAVSADGLVTETATTPTTERQLTGAELAAELLVRALDGNGAPKGHGSRSGIRVSAPSATPGTPGGTTDGGTTTTTGPQSGTTGQGTGGGRSPAFNGAFMSALRSVVAAGAPPSPLGFRLVGDDLVVTSRRDGEARAFDSEGNLVPTPGNTDLDPLDLDPEDAAAEVAARFLRTARDLKEAPRMSKPIAAALRFADTAPGADPTAAHRAADSGVNAARVEDSLDTAFDAEQTDLVAVEYEIWKRKVVAAVTYSSGETECFEFTSVIDGPGGLTVLGWRLMPKCPPREEVVLVDEAQARAYARAVFNENATKAQEAARQREVDAANGGIKGSRRPGHHRPAGGGGSSDSGMFEFDSAFSRGTWSRGTAGVAGEFGGEGNTGTSFSARQLASNLWQSDLPDLHLTSAMTASAWKSATSAPTPRGGIQQLAVADWLALGKDGMDEVLALGKKAADFKGGKLSSGDANKQAGQRAELKRIVTERCGENAAQMLATVMEQSLREADIGGGVDYRTAHATAAGARFAASAYAGAVVRAAELNAAFARSYPHLVDKKTREVRIIQGQRPMVAAMGARRG